MYLRIEITESEEKFQKYNWLHLASLLGQLSSFSVNRVKKGVKKSLYIMKKSRLIQL